MDTKYLSVFLEVVAQGSFAAAARQLDQDPSAISRAIAGLEHDLGVRLFQRTTRSIALTDAGETFRARIDPIVSELESLTEDLKDANTAPRGPLTLSASVAFGTTCVMPHMAAFQALYPDINLTLKFNDHPLDFVREGLDIALRHGPSIEADLISTRLMDTPYRVCVSPAYLDQHSPMATPEDLSAHPVVTYDLPDFKSHWIARDAAGTETKIPVTPKIVISNALGVLEGCLSGMGPALLAHWLADDHIKTGRLVQLFPDHQITAGTFDRAIWMLYPNRTHLPRRTRVMLDFLREKLKPEDPQITAAKEILAEYHSPFKALSKR